MRLLVMFLLALSIAQTVRGDAVVLQPVPGDGSLLRSVPGRGTQVPTVPTASVYQAAWSDNSEPSGIVQTTYTEAPAAQPSANNPALPQTDEHPYFNLQDATESTAAAAPVDDTNELLTRLAIWTVIVLCLCVLTVLGLRHWQRRQGILPPSVGRSRVLETLAIGPGRAVSLVELGDVRAIVGTDGGGIRTIVLAPQAFGEELSGLNTDDDSTHDQYTAA